jgi:CubicO group peptidase (beta-lactamase class C family)
MKILPDSFADALGDRLHSALQENFRLGVEVGAAVSVWGSGGEVASVCMGHADAGRSQPWKQDTLVLVWSATKGVASATLLHALESAGRSWNDPVAAFWPEFARSGKDQLTVLDVMSHRAGLSALDAEGLDMLDHDAVVAAFEAQVPKWAPGAFHAYSPRAYGFFADELVRRLQGVSLGEYWRKELAGPAGIDFWIGLPEEEHDRVAQMIAPRPTYLDPEDPFLLALADPSSLTRAAFNSPGGLSGATIMNRSSVRQASLPSLGGIGSASALAKFYAILAGDGSWEGRRLFGPASLRAMRERVVSGYDETLRLPTSFSAGFMLDPLNPSGTKSRRTLGPSLYAFGHPGAGGSLAFADPELGIGFAYVMNQMEPGVLPKDRVHRLVRALYHEGAA